MDVIKSANEAHRVALLSSNTDRNTVCRSWYETWLTETLSKQEKPPLHNWNIITTLYRCI